MGAINTIKNVSGESEPLKKEEILNKWMKIGLLDGMPEEKQLKCAHIYEQIYKFMINADIRNEHIENVIFPIVYRVVIDTDLETEINYFDIIIAVADGMPEFNNITEQEQYAYEGDFVVKTTNIIIERLKK